MMGRFSWFRYKQRHGIVIQFLLEPLTAHKMAGDRRPSMQSMAPSSLPTNNPEWFVPSAAHNFVASLDQQREEHLCL